jgi:hypothetical protein
VIWSLTCQSLAGFGVEQLDDAGLLRPVDVRRGCHLPEPAGSGVVADRGDRVHVGVPIDPGHQARVREQYLAQLSRQHPAVGPGRARVVDERLQRMGG